MQKRYVFQAAPIWDGFKKQDYGLDIDKDSAGYGRNGHQNNLSHRSETDGPHGTDANIFNVSALFSYNNIVF